MKIIWTLPAAFIYTGVSAQDTSLIVRVRDRVFGPVYSGRQVKTISNRFVAAENLPGILKNKDVVYKFEISEDQKSYPVLKYFQNKSRLFYSKKIYPHNNIPSISPASVKEVVLSTVLIHRFFT